MSRFERWAGRLLSAVVATLGVLIVINLVREGGPVPVPTLEELLAVEGTLEWRTWGSNEHDLEGYLIALRGSGELYRVEYSQRWTAIGAGLRDELTPGVWVRLLVKNGPDEKSRGPGKLVWQVETGDRIVLPYGDLAAWPRG